MCLLFFFFFCSFLTHSSTSKMTRATKLKGKKSVEIRARAKKKTMYKTHIYIYISIEVKWSRVARINSYTCRSCWETRRQHNIIWFGSFFSPPLKWFTWSMQSPLFYWSIYIICVCVLLLCVVLCELANVRTTKQQQPLLHPIAYALHRQKCVHKRRSHPCLCFQLSSWSMNS